MFSKEDYTAFEEKRKFASNLEKQIDTEEKTHKKETKELEVIHTKITTYKELPMLSLPRSVTDWFLYNHNTIPN